jgi:hypothetical protein
MPNVAAPVSRAAKRNQNPLRQNLPMHCDLIAQNPLLSHA